MMITVETPPQLPDILQCSPAEFRYQAKMAMATKLYEMGKISSGMAAQIAGVERVEFLLQLSHYGVPMIDLDEEELHADLDNA
jgi:predicted HTH domain antitoxin